MEMWFIDIPAGEYTTRQLVDMSFPKKSYGVVYYTLKCLLVESYHPLEKLSLAEKRRIKKFNSHINYRNEQIWIWKGGEYYKQWLDEFKNK